MTTQQRSRRRMPARSATVGALLLALVAAPVTVRIRNAESVVQKNTGRPSATAAIVSAPWNRFRGGGGVGTVSVMPKSSHCRIALTPPGFVDLST